MHDVAGALHAVSLVLLLLMSIRRATGINVAVVNFAGTVQLRVVS